MKRQASFKEYTVTIADSGSAEVYKLFKNALKGLRELCEANKIDYPEYMGAQKLGTKLLKEQNGGDATAVSAIVGQYIVSREPNNSIKVSKLYSNTLGSLRELSELVGYEYDEKWNTRTFGNKVIDAIESGEFKKLAKLKKVEETVEIEMDEDTTAEAAAAEETAQVAAPQSDEYSTDWIPDLSYEQEQYFLPKKDEDDWSEKREVNPDKAKDIMGRSLVSIYVDKETREKVVHFDFDYDTFCENCDEDEDIEEKIPEGVVAVCDDNFCDPSEERRCLIITLPDSMRHIGSRCFEGIRVVLNEGLESIGDESIKMPCDYNRKELILPSTLRYIGEKSFEEYDSYLESITIPESVEYIGTGCFEGCDKVKEVIIEGDRFRMENGSLYQGSRHIISFKSMIGGDIVIPEGTTYIQSSAYNNSQLTSVLIPSSVTDIRRSAFSGCTLLKSIVIPEGVTEIGSSAFSDCTSLESIIIPEGVTEIGSSAFAGCTLLKSIVIPKGVTEIGYDVFSDCTSLESIIIPEGVTKIGYCAFKDCTSLKSVVISEGATEIGSEAFSGCTSLESIVIPSSVTKISYDAFCYCDNLTIKWGEGVVQQDGIIYNSDKTELIWIDNPTDVVFPDTLSCSDLSLRILSGCKTLKSVVIPEGVTEIDGTFSGCTSLESIVIPASVTKIGSNAFQYCSSLESIVIPDGITEIKWCTFGGCKALKSIVIPNSVTDIESRVFYECESLESLTIPKSVVAIETIFDRSTRIKTLTIPERFKDRLKDIGVPEECKVTFI